MRVTKAMLYRTFTIALVSAVLPSLGAAQSWTSWNLPNQCTGSVTGALAGGLVTYTGPYNGVQNASLAQCSSPTTPFGFVSPAINYFTANGTTAYAPQPSNGSFVQLVDMVRLNSAGTAYVPISTSTITFSQAVIDPYIAIISAGNNTGTTVSYTFSNLFEIVSYDATGGVAPYWGNTASTYALNTGMMTLPAREFSGVLQFRGTFSSLSFTVDNNENWHGFTVGAPSVIPEPSTYALTAAGLLAVAIAARRRRRRVD